MNHSNSVGGSWAEHRRAASVRRWSGRLAVGALAAVLGSQAVLPRLGYPSPAGLAYRLVKNQAMQLVFGPELKGQAAAQAVIAHTTQGQFLLREAVRLRKIKIGDTFIPGWKLPSKANPLVYIRTAAGKSYQKMALSVLRFEVRQLGVRQIRLGIRWSSTIEPDGHFSLAFYKPYLNFLTSYRDSTGQGVRLLLAIGAFKSPGYPESFVPTLKQLTRNARTALVPTHSLPGMGTRLTPETDPELTSKGLRWLNHVVAAVGVRYPSINYFELDNEPRNQAGPLKWTMSSHLEQQQADVVLGYKPNADFLINWSGTANITGPINLGGSYGPAFESLTLVNSFLINHDSVINEMAALRKSIKEAIKAHQGRGNVTLGLDSYALTPTIPGWSSSILYKGQHYTVRADTTSLIEASERWAGDPHPWQKLRRMGVPLEVTEMQADPWMPYLRPETARQIRLMLYRQLQILPPGQPAVVRLWRLSDDIYTLMYNQAQFTDYQNPAHLSGPTGKFTFNDMKVMQLVAFLGHRSQVVPGPRGKLRIDNSAIDRAIAKYYPPSPPVHQPVVRASG